MSDQGHFDTSWLGPTLANPFHDSWFESEGGCNDTDFKERISIASTMGN